MQGWRKGMEDEHIAELSLHGDDRAAVFGVFDGHGGREVATFCKRYMAAALKSDPRFGDTSGPGPTAQALVSAFHLMDDMMREPQHATELEGYKEAAGGDGAIEPPSPTTVAKMGMAGAEARFHALQVATAAKRAGRSLSKPVRHNNDALMLSPALLSQSTHLGRLPLAAFALLFCTGDTIVCLAVAVSTTHRHH